MADLGAMQSEGGVPHGSGHATNLAVFTLREFERNPGVWDVFTITNGGISRGQGRRGGQDADRARASELPPQENSAGELLECKRGGHSFDQGPIAAAMRLSRIEQAVIDSRLVA